MRAAPQTGLGWATFAFPPGRNRLRANREIGRANGSVFLWAVIDTDPRNADDLSAFQSPDFWYGQR